MTTTSDSSGTRGLWALGFVAVVVVCLAAVPILLDRYRTSVVQTEIATVLEPARVAGLRLALVQARQMARFQAFLLTGERRYVSAYEVALGTEARLYQDLSRLVAGMDLEVRERLARLADRGGRWHLMHQYAFDSEEVRLEMLDAVDEEQARYAEVQGATLALENALQRQVERGRTRVAATREFQTSITLGLVFLALGATVVVGRVGHRYRSLTSEAERRRHEAVQARREIDALLEATGDGVLGIGLDGSCIALNRAGCRLLGFTEREILGRDVHDTIHHTRPDGTPRLRDESPILAALRSGGRADALDDVLWRRNGTSFPARWSVEPMVDGVEIRGAVLSFTDMTEIREKEDQLRRAVRARDEVVSIVSHDLKNPLGVVAGAAELLLDLPLTEDDRRKQAEIIRRSAERMRRLTEDLLDAARLEAGALVIRSAAEDPGSILAEVVDYFRDQAEDRGVVLEMTVAPDTPLVRVDRDRISQALSNLLTNALKHTPAGGTVTLSARPAPAGMVTLCVEDTGPGIPADQQDRLFDRFWQASRDDRTGSGLGLAIVRGISEAHGGFVQVESAVGRGSRFSVFVPVAGGAERPEGRA